MSWVFATDQLRYSSNLPVHLRDLRSLKTLHPEVYKQFMEGRFVGHKSNRAHSGLSVDQLHEQQIADLKGDGGIIGLTDHIENMHEMLVVAPEFARLMNQFEVSSSFTKQPQYTHHEQYHKFQTVFHSDVNALLHSFKDYGNIFMEDSGQLTALDTGRIMNQDVVDSVRNIESLGREKYECFVRERILSQDLPWNATIHNMKLPLMAYNNKPAKKKTDMSAVKKDRTQFVQMLISAQAGREINAEVFANENSEYPPSLTRREEMYFGNKSELLNCLEADIQKVTSSPNAGGIVLDGFVILRLLSPAPGSTFQQYADKFISYLHDKCVNEVSRVDVVWDVRNDQTVKLARASRGSGIRTRVRPMSKIPTNWHGFLRVSSNVTELVEFLADNIQQFNLPGKIIVSTVGERTISSSAELNHDHISPCTHEEADYRIILHVADMARNGVHKVLIRTIDTDVLVLCIAFYHRIQGLQELWLGFGRSNTFRYIPVHVISRRLGLPKCKALLGFHAFTGCDSVSAFYGITKKRAWLVWKDNPKFTPAFQALSNPSPDIPPLMMKLLEEFAVLIYSSTLDSNTVNRARYELFHFAGKDFDNLPPTQNALHLHIRRAAYTGGHIWGQAMTKVPSLPSPTQWGYEIKSDILQPTWTTTPTISKQFIKICHCKTECKPPCVCTVNKVCCTSLCTCRGDCYGHPRF